MKRRLLALLLAVLTLTMLTAAAFAEDTEVLGVYNVTGPLTVTNGMKDGGFYAGADTFELNCTGLTGEYSLVLLLAGDSAVPTEGNIQYIDQTSVEQGRNGANHCFVFASAHHDGNCLGLRSENRRRPNCSHPQPGARRVGRPVRRARIYRLGNHHRAWPACLQAGFCKKE